jgi:hypothetical protein
MTTEPTSNITEAELNAHYGVDDPEAWGDPEPIEKPQRLDVTISVRFTTEEIATLRSRAEAAGMKPTAFIRRAALAADTPPMDRAALRGALRAVADDVAHLGDIVERGQDSTGRASA